MLGNYFILWCIAGLLIIILNLLALIIHKKIEKWTTLPTLPTEDVYREKLKAFCEGLEMQDIDTLMKGSKESFRRVGEVMATRIKKLKEENKNDLE